MTTTRQLCRALGTALQVPGVERHTARLVRDGYLPRSGEEVDEKEAAILLLAVMAAHDPAEASHVIETLMSRELMFSARSVTPDIVMQNLDADRDLLPLTVIDALADALEFENFGTIPGLRINRLSVEHGALCVTIDVTVELPTGPIFLCAQYGAAGPLAGGLQAYVVAGNVVLRAVARALHPSEVQRDQQEPLMSSVLMH